MGERITFPSNGGSCPAYLAVPAGGSGPGVVVIQEWWGLVPHIESVCDRLAAEGFVALAADLYHGAVAAEPDEAAKNMMALKLEDSGRDLSGAVDWLLADPRCTGDAVGVVGFCMGGGLALSLAAQRREVAACVPFYGVGSALQAVDLTAVRGAVLGHWAADDRSYTREQIAEIEQSLSGAASVEMLWYEGCGHAFFNDDRPEVYNAEAAQLAWDRTVAFLRQQLTPA
jgi:carboxymethylenebutenolidase